MRGEAGVGKVSSKAAKKESKITAVQIGSRLSDRSGSVRNPYLILNLLQTEVIYRTLHSTEKKRSPFRKEKDEFT